MDAVCDTAAGQVAASGGKVPARSSRSPRHVSEDLVRTEGTVTKTMDSSANTRTLMDTIVL